MMNFKTLIIYSGTPKTEIQNPKLSVCLTKVLLSDTLNR